MKLHHKLYLFFAAIVVLPLLVATIGASMMLKRSGTDTYESRLRSGLAAASAIISSQAQGLSRDFQGGLGSAGSGALAGADPGRRTSGLAALMEKTGAAGAVIIDENGNIIAHAGASLAESPPMLAATAQLNGAEGFRWRIRVFRPFDAGSLESVFSPQGLDWGLTNAAVVALGSLNSGELITTEDGGPAGQLRMPLPGEPAGDSFRVRYAGTDMLASSLDLPADITSRETVLFAGVPMDVVDAASEQALGAGIALMLVVAVVAAILGFLLAWNITRPLRELNKAVCAGIQGNLDRPVEHRARARDEIGSLSDSFNLMHSMAITDPMTGLNNFRYLKDYLNRELSKSRRYSHELTLAIIDLDDFKAVNDRWGHPAGDALLKAVAEVLAGSVRSADMVARYGGEEFAVVFAETSKRAAVVVMEKLRRKISDIRLPDYHRVRITASIGVACFPDDAEDRTGLLASADKSLYYAKQAGKDQVNSA